MDENPIFLDADGIKITGTHFDVPGRSFPLTQLKNVEFQATGFLKAKIVVDTFKERIEAAKVSGFLAAKVKVALGEALAFYNAKNPKRGGQAKPYNK